MYRIIGLENSWEITLSKAWISYSFFRIEIYIPANFFWGELEIPVKSYPICYQKEKKTVILDWSSYFILEAQD